MVRSVVHLDLACIAAKLQRKRWSPRRIEKALSAYRDFLEEARDNPAALIRPSQDVDMVWHVHILHTKKYREDCLAIFGYYLDHEPDGEEVPFFDAAPTGAKTATSFKAPANAGIELATSFKAPVLVG